MNSGIKLQEKAQQTQGQLESFRFYPSWGCVSRRLSSPCTDLCGLGESVKRRSKTNQPKLLLETFLGQILWHLLKVSSIKWGSNLLLNLLCCILSQLLWMLVLCDKLGIHDAYHVPGKLVLFYFNTQTMITSFHKV